MVLGFHRKSRVKAAIICDYGTFLGKTFLISDKISADKGVFIGPFGDEKRVSVLFFSTLSAGCVS